MSATMVVTLPHGLWDGNERRSTAELRLPTGSDEAHLLATRDRGRAEQVTELLSRCLVRVDERAADQELVRSLTAGDREALLLHLRAHAFGDALACTVDCPSCGERMDVDVTVTDLVVPPYADVRETHVIAVTTDTGTGRAIVRLPTGADLEAAALRQGTGGGVDELLERCVTEWPAGARGAPAATALAEALSGRLAELDPQAEITIAVDCPACGEPVGALLDAASVLFAELAGSEERLLGEVDAIARVYHWPEDDILGLDVRRRRRYLELVTDSEAGS